MKTKNLKDLKAALFALIPHNVDITFLCIGTDRSTGDALGPLVGTALTKMGYENVYGTLDNPVHAMNIEEVYSKIRTNNPTTFVVAIDACLGSLQSVGYIVSKSTPLSPGAGVGKDLISVGDMSIAGIVNVGGFMEYFVLQNTRLSLVMNMADMIAGALHQTITESKEELAV